MFLFLIDLKIMILIPVSHSIYQYLIPTALPTRSLYDSHYLYDLLSSNLVKLFITHTRSYEVDQPRMEQHKSMDENRKNLLALIPNVFQAIADSIVNLMLLFVPSSSTMFSTPSSISNMKL